MLLTGHGLGGAYATLAATHLMAVGVQVDDIYTFGSPRVGDSKFHQWFTKMMNGRFVSRVTHNKDSVPHFPLES